LTDRCLIYRNVAQERNFPCRRTAAARGRRSPSRVGGGAHRFAWGRQRPAPRVRRGARVGAGGVGRGVARRRPGSACGARRSRRVTRGPWNSATPSPSSKAGDRLAS